MHAPLNIIISFFFGVTGYLLWCLGYPAIGIAVPAIWLVGMTNAMTWR